MNDYKTGWFGLRIVQGFDNLIYFNNFTENINGQTMQPLNAEDNSGNNKWDNGTIGNYWDDYLGKDSDDNTIGDTPYTVSGSSGGTDRYPIWWDPPIIIINSPNTDDVFDGTPHFNISIDEGNVNSTWYSLDNGLKNITFSGLTGQIHQTEWDKRLDGILTIRFFANDSKGYVGFTNVTVLRESIPQITINLPTINNTFGINSPRFNITVNDLSPINNTWYTIDGGLTNYTFSDLNGFINQSAWEQREEGIIIIRFYAKDSLGYRGFKDVQISKDTINPAIIIYFPYEDRIFGTISPDFNVSIIDEDLAFTWYTINGSLIQYLFTGSIGTIDQGAWDVILEGEINITFYAQDRAGNIGTETTIVIKRIPPPASIPGYNVYLLYGVIFLGIIITLQRKHKS